MLHTSILMEENHQILVVYHGKSPKSPNESYYTMSMHISGGFLKLEEEIHRRGSHLGSIGKQVAHRKITMAFSRSILYQSMAKFRCAKNRLDPLFRPENPLDDHHIFPRIW